MKFLLMGRTREHVQPHVQQRAIAKFVNWPPPKEAKVDPILVSADNDLVFIIAETTNLEPLYEAVVQHSECLKWQVFPVFEATRSAPIALRALEWSVNHGEPKY